MAHIPAQTSGYFSVSPSSELADAPRAIVCFGVAPDGLAWLIDADRSHRLQRLMQTVLSVFELSDPDELPERVRHAIENDLAVGLMGVHEADVDGLGARRVYVSRRKTKHLLGPTLLSQIIEQSGPPPQHAPPVDTMGGGGAITNVGALAVGEQDEQMVEAVERSIDERRAKRHLMIALAGAGGDAQTFSASVHTRDRALRVPREPFRPLVFESLLGLEGVEAKLSASGESWRVPLLDRAGYNAAIQRVHHSPYGGDLSFAVPRLSLLRALVAVARDVAKLHARGLVHGDLAPGNVLLAADGPISFDSLDVKAGSPATAATFEWAAPEQIVGQPVEPHTDVFSLGKMAATLVRGVPFGEETNYIVPIGGGDSRRVNLLKGEGVFIDILETGYTRKWQLAWQELLGRCIAYDRTRRPEHAGAFADALEALVAEHPPEGTLSCAGHFGFPVAVHPQSPGLPGGAMTFARLVSD
ncbi:MAG: hypothetical protein KC503_12005 [Myxococcales bacterium]|nr:hypothetical protein [Myxococcales bacterium]